MKPSYLFSYAYSLGYGPPDSSGGFLKMKTKSIILFLTLTILLMSLSYTLLGMIVRHSNVLLVIILAAAVIADLIVLTRLFQRFMRP